jgi:hypothetical protein
MNPWPKGLCSGSCGSLEKANSSLICGFAQFAALIADCGSILQREQQPDFCSIWRSSKLFMRK